jgi:hypothetical protein
MLSSPSSAGDSHVSLSEPTPTPTPSQNGNERGSNAGDEFDALLICSSSDENCSQSKEVMKLTFIKYSF